jgi:hypothetical protein
MDKYKHTDLLLLQSAELTERTPFCPEDQCISCFFDGELSDGDRASLRRHLADCRYCQARIGLMYQLHENVDVPQVSENTLADAKKLHLANPQSPARKAASWATAAVLVLAVFSIVNLNELSQQDAETEHSSFAPGVDGHKQLRSFNRNTQRLQVQIDSPVEAVRPGTRVRWPEVKGKIHYTIQVLSETGDIVWTERSASPEWTVQDSIQLAAGDSYFLRIEAVLPNGETISSRHISFHAADLQ